MLTKKDYVMLIQAIAESSYIRTSRGSVVVDFDTLIEKLCRRLKENNPRFDDERFRTAAYKEIMNVSTTD